MEVEIRRYQRELGIPFLYVTHNQEEALTMSDRIAVMRTGVFDQIAPRTEVYSHPATAFVASFVGHSNRLEGAIASVSGQHATLSWNGMDIVVPRPAGASLGDRIVLFIKYEEVELAGGSDLGPKTPSDNRLEGVLRDVIFKGQTANYFVRLANGAEIVASGTPRALSLKPGAAVSARWPAGVGSSFPAAATP
jgi:ABC-type Fe3+/spermidine/putrescine transport system ATPase subunit